MPLAEYNLVPIWIIPDPVARLGLARPVQVNQRSDTKVVPLSVYLYSVKVWPVCEPDVSLPISPPLTSGYEYRPRMCDPPPHIVVFNVRTWRGA